MTTYAQIVTEIQRQQARLNFLTDPVACQILSRSILDLSDMLKAYPTGLIWAAEPKGEAPAGE